MNTGNVTNGNGPMFFVRSSLTALHNEGQTISAIAKHFGLNKSIVSRILKTDSAWSAQAIEAVTGEHWVSLRVHCHLADDLPREGCPSILETTIELCQCPITEKWFLPLSPTQRYYPCLSPALKRAFRRNPDEARVKYGKCGDWGKGDSDNE